MIKVIEIQGAVADARDSLKETIEKFGKAMRICEAAMLPNIAKAFEADLDLLEDIFARLEGDES